MRRLIFLSLPLTALAAAANGIDVSADEKAYIEQLLPAARRVDEAFGRKRGMTGTVFSVNMLPPFKVMVKEAVDAYLALGVKKNQAVFKFWEAAKKWVDVSPVTFTRWGAINFTRDQLKELRTQRGAIEAIMELYSNSSAVLYSEVCSTIPSIYAEAQGLVKKLDGLFRGVKGEYVERSVEDAIKESMEAFRQYWSYVGIAKSAFYKFQGHPVFSWWDKNKSNLFNIAEIKKIKGLYAAYPNILMNDFEKIIDLTTALLPIKSDLRAVIKEINNIDANDNVVKNDVQWLTTTLLVKAKAVDRAARALQGDRDKERDSNAEGTLGTVVNAFINAVSEYQTQFIPVDEVKAFFNDSILYLCNKYVQNLAKEKKEKINTAIFDVLRAALKTECQKSKNMLADHVQAFIDWYSYKFGKKRQDELKKLFDRYKKEVEKLEAKLNAYQVPKCVS